MRVQQGEHVGLGEVRVGRQQVVEQPAYQLVVLRRVNGPAVMAESHRAGNIAQSVTLVQEMQSYRARIVELEAALGQAIRNTEVQRGQLAELAEEKEFFEGSSEEFAGVFEALKTELSASWHALAALPDGDGLGIVLEWLDRALLCGSDPGPMLPREVVEGEEGEECGVTFVRQIAPAQSGK